MTKKELELKRAYDRDGLWNLQEFNVDLFHRELYLVGETGPHAGCREPGEILPDPGVDYQMASVFIRNLNSMVHVSDEPILVHMKTCGGDVSEGFAIYDAIKTCSVPVVILSYTHARSMSSIILQAADKRVLMPNSYFMFHRGSAEFAGEQRAVRSMVRFYERYEDLMLAVYIDAMKATPGSKHYDSHPDALKILLSTRMGNEVDVFLTAKQTVEWGLADEIFDKGTGTWEQAWARLREVK